MSQERSCCGVVEESAARARERRDDDAGAQPWIVLKLTVGITWGIMGYAAYVYAGVFVKPMLQEKQGALASRTTGIALLVPGAVLFVWMVWSYAKVVLTPPGFARDYVEKSAKPPFPQSPLAPLYPPLDPTNGEQHLGRPSYEMILKATPPTEEVATTPWSAALAAKALKPPSEIERSASTMTIMSGSSHNGLRFNAGEMVNPTLHEDNDTVIPKPPAIAKPSSRRDFEVGPPPPPPPPTTPRRKRRSSGKLQKHGKVSGSWLFCCCAPCAGDRQGDTLGQAENGQYKSKGPRTYIARRPPMTPYLHPAHRYCDRDGFVKPYRAHHCRSCGTCVLKYDHHCPWIGQCVGARNHKFFLIFCQAAFFCTAYIFASMLPFVVKGFQTTGRDVNPQQLVIIALAGLFALFTFSLCISHMQLIMGGKTTVEHMEKLTIKQRESEQLAKAYSWWQVTAKHHTTKEWDKEWGKINTEGHVWWIGGKRREWEAVMGKNPLGWILPIGETENDGLDYPVNPRYDHEGRWRRRVEWPQGLQ